MNNISLNLNVISINNDNNNTNSATYNNVNNKLNLNSNNNVANKSANIFLNQTKSTNSAESNAEKQKELSKQIESNLNPPPMLSQAMLFKWDASAGGAVINVVDFKTGKVLAQIPPNSVLKMMSNYQKGNLYSSKL